MGIDQGTVGMLQQGVNMVGDIVNPTGGNASVYAGEADQRGLLSEAETKGDALDARRMAQKEARAQRDLRENIRSKRTMEWGGSNLAMSGSKQLVKQGQRTKDIQAEEDILFEGQMKADSILAAGRNKANLLRINGGDAPKRSTLSLGSKIYSRR